MLNAVSNLLSVLLGDIFVAWVDSPVIMTLVSLVIIAFLIKLLFSLFH